MILSHEIPKGSKIYFGKNAKSKRNLENLISSILDSRGYDEIVMPTFSYLQYQRDIQNRESIRISNPYNHQIILRQDSTLDAIRLLAPYLNDNTIGKKLFYIQPVFIYPTTEINQIGVENLENDDVMPFLDICFDVLKAVNINPYLQIGNGRIASICHLEFDIPLDVFCKMDISAISKSDPFLKELLEVRDIKTLNNVIPKSPIELKGELEKLADISSKIQYDNLIVSPLMYPPMSYYDDVFFRFFVDNDTIILGGSYEILDKRASGFGIYTDNIMNKLCN